jgi:hypothetical protein
MPNIDYFLYTEVPITKGALLSASDWVRKPHLEFHKDGRTWNKDRISAMSLLLCNVVWHEKRGSVKFHYSRKRESVNRQFNPVAVKIDSLLSCIDSLASAKFIKHVKAKPRTKGTPRDNMTSEFQVTSKGLMLCAILGLTKETIQEHKRFHVRLRPEGRPNLVPYEHDEYSAHIEQLMVSYCEHLNAHRISVPSNQSTVGNIIYLEYGRGAERIHLYRNYREYTKAMEEEIGDTYPFIETNWNFAFAGRSGGYWHGTKSELRPHITIDGKPTDKVDIPCCHINLCYRDESETGEWHQKETHDELKADGREMEDAYYLPNVERDVVKKMVLIMFNVKRRSGASSSFNKWRNQSHEDRSKNASDEEVRMYKRSLKATGLTDLEFNNWLIQQVLKKHDRIKGYFLKGKLGGQIVQAVEANVMHHLAAYFQEAHGFACLTVYDEFIVPSERIEMVREHLFNTVSCGICEQHSILKQVRYAKNHAIPTRKQKRL